MHMHARTHSPGSGSIVLPTTTRARVCELCFDPPTVIRVTSRKFQDYNISPTRSIYTFRQQANLSPSGRGTRRRRRRLRVSRVNGNYKGKVHHSTPHMHMYIHACMHTHTHTTAHTHSPGSGSIVFPTIAQGRVRAPCFDSPIVMRSNKYKINDMITTSAGQEAYLSAASQLVVLWLWCPLQMEETEAEGIRILYNKNKQT